MRGGKDIKLFYFFLILGFLFYLVLFDFSIGALDRYFQFMIVPLVIISAVVTDNIFTFSKDKIKWKIVIPIFAITVLIFKLQFLTQTIPPLYPKTDWINRIFSLKWNFLYPFNGGSGPLPFYVSWGFIGYLWI